MRGPGKVLDEDLRFQIWDRFGEGFWADFGLWTLAFGLLYSSASYGLERQAYVDIEVYLNFS